jgi:DNA polymerase V
MTQINREHGGRRLGAGRPAGTGKWKGEPTQMMRVPVSRKTEVKSLLESQGYCLNVFDMFVQAGAMTPLGDEVAERKDVMELLGADGDSFTVIANGDSMINANIHSGDMLVVDSLARAKEGDIIVASIDGDFTVKRLKKHEGQMHLMPENPDFSPIPILDDSEFKIYGVVRKKIADIV